MAAKESIIEAIKETKGEGFGNACQVWKGYGDMGQRPYGWWVKPFGQNSHYIGKNVDEATEFYLD